MTKTEIDNILKKHAAWLRGEDGGERANLTGANLTGANLTDASLTDADLTDASLTRADLTRANLPHFQICPEQGAFTAFKKLRGGNIARLLIPEDAQRTSSLVGRKCRASKVIVLSLSDGEVGYGMHDSTVYRVGATVEPDSYDPDIRVECTHGIHFFVTEREAQEY